MKVLHRIPLSPSESKPFESVRKITWATLNTPAWDAQIPNIPMRVKSLTDDLAFDDRTHLKYIFKLQRILRKWIINRIMDERKTLMSTAAIFSSFLSFSTWLKTAGLMLQRLKQKRIPLNHILLNPFLNVFFLNGFFVCNTLYYIGKL